MTDEEKAARKQRRRQERQLQRALRQRRALGADGPRPELEASHVESPPVAGPDNRRQITSSQLTGLKYFEKLAPLLERLRDVGCERDKAGNRDLHFDQYCLLILAVEKTTSVRCWNASWSRTASTSWTGDMPSSPYSTALSPRGAATCADYATTVRRR